ncbi:hypothetical protein PFTANZ_06283 [Plasmodium falciparum Tanzania (2000708)]|uniref:Uncharacterized protein n=1 Tax=Plasmodium falciparum Tanzania (2000708) TaxID=1036725 RepID=A0A024VXF7_PLAFA|nr:hypothetical protein PFTANZ_06283 [Plasmodium falciparum Tanzania (2000708)]
MGVQSLYYLVWSISAYFGGWLSDISSYRNTFKITTFFYLISLIIYAPLLWTKLKVLYNHNIVIYKMYVCTYLIIFNMDMNNIAKVLYN